DDAAAAEWPGVAPAGLRVHAVTGLARSASRLKQRPPQVLAGAVKDLAALVQRAALKLDHVASRVVAWPEALIAGEHAAALDALLGAARAALPSGRELAALVRLGEPIVFLSAAQLPYLRSITKLAPFSLPGAAGRARDRAEELRERVARVLLSGGVDAELALLDPLFER